MSSPSGSFSSGKRLCEAAHVGRSGHFASREPTYNSITFACTAHRLASLHLRRKRNFNSPNTTVLLCVRAVSAGARVPAREAHHPPRYQVGQHSPRHGGQREAQYAHRTLNNFASTISRSVCAFRITQRQRQRQTRSKYSSRTSGDLLANPGSCARPAR